jgi:hypothetical protein
MTHDPAAFINAIAEKGTKDDAVQCLQKTWIELSEARAEIKRLNAGLNLIAEAGMTQGAAWCVEQAIGYRDNLVPP